MSKNYKIVSQYFCITAVLLFMGTNFYAPILSFQAIIENSQIMAYHKKKNFVEISFINLQRETKKLYFFVKREKEFTHIIPLQLPFSLTLDEISSHYESLFANDMGSMYPGLAKNLEFSEYCLDLPNIRVNNSIFRLDTVDGSPWKFSLPAHTAAPKLIDVSSQLVALPLYGITEKNIMRHFYCYELIKDIIERKPDSFSNDEKFKFFIFYKLFKEEKKAVVREYNKHNIPHVDLLQIKINFSNMVKFYSALIAAGNKSSHDIEQINFLINNSNSFFKFKYFLVYIMRMINWIINQLSYSIKELLDIETVLLFTKKLFHFYPDDYHPDPFLEDQEFFLTDFLFYVSSYITQSVPDGDLQKQYVYELTQIIYPSKIYYPLLKKLCEKNKKKTILFKPIIRKIIILNYLTGIFSTERKGPLPNDLAKYIISFWQPTTQFMDSLLLPGKKKNQDCLIN